MSDKTVGAAGAAGVFDFTCDGIDDHAEIVAAMTAAGTGSTVHLSAGTFNCAGDIIISAGVSLIGTPATILQFSGEVVWTLQANGANAVQDLALRGPVTFAVRGSGVHCARLVSRQAIHGTAAFMVYVVGGETISDFLFEDCDAIGTSGIGFYTSGTGVVRDGAFVRCTAIGCGAAHDNANAITREWIVGFDFCEAATCSIENVQAIDCHAENCYESGFHCELLPTVTACQLVRCTSTGNGTIKPTPSYGAGFVLPPSWTCEGCTAEGNGKHGFLIANHVDNPHSGQPAHLRRCHVTGPSVIGYAIVAETGGPPIDALVMEDCSATAIVAPNDYILLSNVTGAQITNFRKIDSTGYIYQAYGSSDNLITYYLEQFATAPPAPVTGEAVAFADVSDNDGLAAWSWDFGDGSGSAAQHPTHAYPTAGVYPVTLAAGGNAVSSTVTVVPGVSYGGARLSEADLAPLDHDPVANATDLQNGRVGLQGSPVSRRTWTINALADDHAEIEALAALTGQHAVLNINGVEYPGTMIRPPLLETQLTPAAWAYQVGFVQETRR